MNISESLNITIVKLLFATLLRIIRRLSKFGSNEMTIMCGRKSAGTVFGQKRALRIIFVGHITDDQWYHEMSLPVFAWLPKCKDGNKRSTHMRKIIIMCSTIIGIIILMSIGSFIYYKHTYEESVIYDASSDIIQIFINNSDDFDEFVSKF